jgi:hypothetical protein
MNQSDRCSDLELFEDTSHPFIVSIWLEETVAEAGKAVWRGYVTHVPSGKRRYLNDLEDIVAFIAPYLEQVGVEFGFRSQVRRWVRLWTSQFRG